jgi:hypothetical protein
MSYCCGEKGDGRAKYANSSDSGAFPNYLADALGAGYIGYGQQRGKRYQL